MLLLCACGALHSKLFNLSLHGLQWLIRKKTYERFYLRSFAFSFNKNEKTFDLSVS